MAGGDGLLPIGAAQFSQISSAFSIAYGLCQPIGGYVMDKVGIKTLCPVLLLGASIATYTFSNYTDPAMAIYSRYVLGICFCVASTGTLKYFSMVWEKYFSILCNILPILMCLSAALASSGIVRQWMVDMGWRHFLRTCALIGVVIALLLYITLHLVLSKKSDDSVRDKNYKTEENISFLTGLKEIFSTPGAIPTMIFCFCTCSAGYVIMEGWANTLAAMKFPHLGPSSLALPATFNMLGNAAAFIYNIVMSKLKEKTQMFIYVLINIVSLAGMVFGDFGFNGFLACCFFLGWSGAGQNIGFIWLQKNLSSKYLGLGFGILNCCCMFFGCALVQNLAGKILDLLKSNAISSGISYYEGYRYLDLINMFKFLFVPGVIALIAVFFIKNVQTYNRDR